MKRVRTVPEAAFTITRGAYIQLSRENCSAGEIKTTTNLVALGSKIITFFGNKILSHHPLFSDPSIHGRFSRETCESKVTPLISKGRPVGDRCTMGEIDRNDIVKYIISYWWRISPYDLTYIKHGGKALGQFGKEKGAWFLSRRGIPDVIECPDWNRTLHELVEQGQVELFSFFHGLTGNRTWSQVPGNNRTETNRHHR